MKQTSTSRRFNAQAQAALARIVLFEIADPRLRLVTIINCEVSVDRSICNVYYTCEPSRYEEVASAFDGAKGRIRHLLSQELGWKVTPELRFHRDPSVDTAQAIAKALQREEGRMARSDDDGANGDEAAKSGVGQAVPAKGAASSGGEDSRDR